MAQRDGGGRRSGGAGAAGGSARRGSAQRGSVRPGSGPDLKRSAAAAPQTGASAGEGPPGRGPPGRGTTWSPRPGGALKALDHAAIAAQQAEGRAWFVDEFAVSRETLARLDTYVALLTEWQQCMNLVAPSTLGDVWRRHVADSLGLEALLPAAGSIVDLGSGGGLPALVVAACRPETPVEMIESSQKKCAFLAASAAAMRVEARPHPLRIENAGAVVAGAGIVTARALASLDTLLRLVAPRVSRETRCFFQKGRTHEQEIAEAAAHWRFTMIIHASRLEADSVVLEIADIAPRAS
ncbi:16S rRNA (guanine(527)-N(7))-methyltransferase RsmG [Jiella sonneratiae]|uniref:Ribosomal RNA small subunit methyltransferase G n=1 Tax=Jiella sonneratiae TaxID=2816856 RepID=A0ABS3J0U7_9HYPH|nr:16S rRNA (guanine(527)-N(7))-methyltransferase RsmG [Jiella sonneratiae]MBO0903282.1 16S rRNA (guanine(527)-N(7))-methyltransferase RsmG [Jiella sonneratiae]